MTGWSSSAFRMSQLDGREPRLADVTQPNREPSKRKMRRAFHHDDGSARSTRRRKTIHLAESLHLRYHQAAFLVQRPAMARGFLDRSGMPCHPPAGRSAAHREQEPLACAR